MSMVAMLLMPPELPKGKARRGAPKGADNPTHKARVKVYREAMRGKQLTTPQVAKAVGAKVSSNIIYTLYRLQDLQLVKAVGTVPRSNGLPGKRAIVWEWTGD